MLGFLKALLIIFSVILIFRIIFRLYGRRILNYFLRKVTERATGRSFDNTQNFNEQSGKTGKTRVHKTTTSKRQKKNEPVGEYIDYEEVD